MKSLTRVLIAFLIAISIIFYSTPAASSFSDLNFLVWGSVYLRKPSWTQFILTNYPSRLGQNDIVRVERGVEAVILCSNFSRHNIPSGSNLSMSSVCPSGRGRNVIPNENGNSLPTSSGSGLSDVESRRYPDIFLSLERALSSISRLGTFEQEISDRYIEEINASVSQLESIEIPDASRDVVIAELYAQKGFISVAISLLENALQVEDFSQINDIPVEFSNLNSFQLLGDLYNRDRQYEKAKSIYISTLAIMLRSEIDELSTIEPDSAIADIADYYRSVDVLRRGVLLGVSPRFSSNQNQYLDKKAQVLLSLGEIALRENNYKQAKNSLTAARTIYRLLEGNNSPTANALDIESLANNLNSEEENLEERYRIVNSLINTIRLSR
ncbi:MAG: hypothetical protein WA949_23650 [Phormidesmis sp.]